MSPTRRSELRARGWFGLWAMFAITPLVFLLAVRRDVGTDYQAYVHMFELFRAGASLPRIEPLYALLNRVSGLIGSSGIVLVFGSSATLAALPLFYRIFRSSPLPWLGVVILFGLSLPFFMTNGVRSAIAIGIVMLVLPAIWRRQIVVWTLGIVFAMGFHFTVLLVWPLYWVLHRAWPRAVGLLGLAVGIVISVNRDIAMVFLQWVPAVVPSKYQHYVGIVIDRMEAYEFGLGYAIYISLTGLLLITWRQFENMEREVLVFRNASLVGLLVLIAFYQFSYVGRLGLYFTPLLGVFLPWIVIRSVARRDRIVWVVAFIALFGLLFVRGLWIGSHQAVPYQWIL